MGIWNRGGGTVNLGKNDGSMSTSSPKIYGYKVAAMYSPSGVWNFYDGTLYSVVNPAYNNNYPASNLATGYILQTDSDSTYGYKTYLVKDTTSPSISIYNPYENVWTNKNFDLTISFSDSGSGINPNSLQWSYDGTNWNSITNNTSTSSYVHSWTPGSGGYNGYGYYKICDYANNCSTASTRIKNDKTAPTLTLSHNAGVITITSDTSNLYSGSYPGAITRDPSTWNSITAETSITDVSSSSPGPVSNSPTWKLDTSGSSNPQWIGWQDTYGSVFSGNANDIIIISGYYKTSAKAGVSAIVDSGLYKSDWSAPYSTTSIDSQGNLIEDGNWHYFYSAFRVNEAYSNAIISSGPAWGYTTQKGTLYVNGINWRVIPSSNTTAGDIHVRKWASGSQTLSYFQNGGGTQISGNSFQITSPGTYTVYVEDAAGNGTIQTITPSFYYLDLNGYLDGSTSGGLGSYGTADVYVNGSLVCNDCTDYYTQHPSGSTYSITDIKATTGHTYNGVYSGSLSGTITSGVGVYLNFSTNSYTITSYYYYYYENSSWTHFDTRTDTRTYGSSFSPYNVGTPTGYYAGNNYGYYDSSGNYIGSGTVGSNSFTVTGNMIVHVHYYPNTYYIYYNANGGSNAPGATSYTYSDRGTVTLSTSTPSRSGYNFLGWSTSSSAGSPSYSAGGGFSKTTASNTTLYAVWGLPTGIYAYRGTANGLYESGTKDFLYITTCDSSNSGYCNFTAKNADAASGTIIRGSLTSSVEAGSAIATTSGSTTCNSTSCTVYVFTQSGLTDRTASANQIVGVLYANRISTTYPVYKTSSVSGNYRKVYFSYNTGANIIQNFTLSYYAYGAGTIQSITYQGTWYFGWTFKTYVV